MQSRSAGHSPPAARHSPHTSVVGSHARISSTWLQGRSPAWPVKARRRTNSGSCEFGCLAGRCIWSGGLTSSSCRSGPSRSGVVMPSKFTANGVVDRADGDGGGHADGAPAGRRAPERAGVGPAEGDPAGEALTVGGGLELVDGDVQVGQAAAQVGNQLGPDLGGGRLVGSRSMREEVGRDVPPHRLDIPGVELVHECSGPMRRSRCDPRRLLVRGGRGQGSSLRHASGARA